MDFLKRAISPTALNGVSNDTSTQSQLASQWTNPSDVLSVLLIIGGDIVQKALAQTSGGSFTPVCFSFGWVAYSFTALIGVIGDGRLLPPPDYPVKVFNLQNGYARENKNWVVGRILRDNEIRMSKQEPLAGNAIRISIYKALPRRSGYGVAGVGRVRFFGAWVMVLQLGIASIPVALYSEWGILMITAGGTLLALTSGALSQWQVEKLPTRRRTKKNIALTAGNGSRDIMIVFGCGNGLDLEELAASESPRSTRLWEMFPRFSKELMEKSKPRLHKNGEAIRSAITFRGIPVGFWITNFICAVQSMFWIALLITVAGLRSHTWYLLLVGGLGMFQNATVAAISRDPEKRSLPLLFLEAIKTRTVMDGLMDLEVTHPDSARRLVREFFPGDLYPDESDWWNGETASYDSKRCKEHDRRSYPRSMQPKFRTTPSGFTETDLTEDEPHLSLFRTLTTFFNGRKSTFMQWKNKRNVEFEQKNPPISHTSPISLGMTPRREIVLPDWIRIETTGTPSANESSPPNRDGAAGIQNPTTTSVREVDYNVQERQGTDNSGTTISVDDLYQSIQPTEW